MSSHFERRTPQRNGGFSWGRFPGENTIEWRLFSRDHTGAVHIARTTIAKDVPMNLIARELRRQRRELRCQVASIDQAAKGGES